MIFKKLPEPHETQEKFIKKILHLMFSAGKYRSTEKLEYPKIYIFPKTEFF